VIHPDSMPDSVPQRIAFAQAQAIVAAVAAAHRLPVERRPLTRALGAVLAEDIVATSPLPGFDNSAMDGFAVRSDDGVAPRRMVGEQFAGVAQDLAIGPGECVRITTGGRLPAGADAILIKENARVDGDSVHALEACRAGQHVRRMGEDVAVGDVVLVRGERLGPSQVSLAAALGLPELPVHRRPTVAVFTTGDELRAPGQALAPGEIHDSNRSLLLSLLLAEGLEPVAWPVLPDDPARIASARQDAAFSVDVVITCGGGSAGEKDHVTGLLAREGAVHFWKVRMRPGMPLLFGRLGQAHFLGLPGNPVSVLATFLTLGRALLDGIEGATAPRALLRARLRGDLRKAHPRLEFLRGRLACGEDAMLSVEPNPADGSHRLRAAAASNALIVLPEGEGAWSAGTVLDVLPYADWR
jgi:molybdopterin molybdotransferase